MASLIFSRRSSGRSETSRLCLMPWSMSELVRSLCIRMGAYAATLLRGQRTKVFGRAVGLTEHMPSGYRLPSAQVCDAPTFLHQEMCLW